MTDKVDKKSLKRHIYRKRWEILLTNIRKTIINRFVIILERIL